MTSETNYVMTYIKGRGYFEVTTAAMDAAMARYLPASPAQLRAVAKERTGMDYYDVLDVSAFLTILADFDYNVDDSPLRRHV